MNALDHPKIKRVKVVGYLPNLIYHVCVFKHRPLERCGLFIKCHLILGGKESKIVFYS